MVAEDDARDHVVKQVIGVVEVQEVSLLGGLAQEPLSEPRLAHGLQLGVGSVAAPLGNRESRLPLRWHRAQSALQLCQVGQAAVARLVTTGRTLHQPLHQGVLPAVGVEAAGPEGAAAALSPLHGGILQQTFPLKCLEGRGSRSPT